MDGQGSAVVLNQDGDIGKYNRANRSLTQFVEYALPLISCLPINFYLWPVPTFILVCVYFLGRLWHQVGYAQGGFGPHMMGFLIFTQAAYMLVGLMMIAYVKIVF